ncbi:MAG TPA: hypothetical protein VG389_12630 [Myxococcota bacterium]|nr:hypothetical protein [Myxococcota bacterium]
MKPIRWIVLRGSVAVGAVLVIAGVACGRPAVCNEITEACHPVDPGSGPIHDCHEGSEAGGRARRTARWC